MYSPDGQRPQQLRKLRDALVKLYPNAEDAQRLAADVGLPLGALDRTSTPVNVWHNVLAEVRAVQPGLSRCVLIFDQFEETFTLCADETVRRAFLAALVTAAETSWFTVILTVRADFFGHLLAEARLGQRVDGGQVNVLPMSNAERRAAIEQPALNAGRHFADGLVQRIVGAVAAEPGELPLLEFALTEL